MPRSPIVEHLNARNRALRDRRITVFSTPRTADADEDRPRLRWTIDQACRARNASLTEERRRLAMIFDETDAPLSVSDVWRRAKDRDLKASRSYVYQLVRALVASRVLIIAENGHTIRYATPLAVRLQVRSDGEGPATAIEDPLAIEALVAALLRAGRPVGGHDLVIDLVTRVTQGPDNPQACASS